MRFLLKTFSWVNVILGIIWILSIFVLPGGFFDHSTSSIMGQIGGKFSVLVWGAMFLAFGLLCMNSVGKSYSYVQTAFILAVIMCVFSVLDLICCFINPIIIHILIVRIIILIISFFNVISINMTSNNM